MPIHIHFKQAHTTRNFQEHNWFQSHEVKPRDSPGAATFVDGKVNLCKLNPGPRCVGIGGRSRSLDGAVGIQNQWSDGIATDRNVIVERIGGSLFRKNLDRVAFFSRGLINPR